MSNRIPKGPKNERLDFLVSRKFPNAVNVESAYNKPKPINPVSSRDNSRNERIFAELELRYEAIQDYRKELSLKSSEDLEAFYIEEQNIRWVIITTLLRWFASGPLFSVYIISQNFAANSLLKHYREISCRLGSLLRSAGQLIRVFA